MGSTSREQVRERVLEELQGLRTVDCHSHTKLRKDYYGGGPFDLFTLGGYFERDIESTTGQAPYAGASSDEEKWNVLRGVLAKARNVSYWRHSLVVYRELLGFEDAELDDDNWQRLSAAISEKSADDGWYDHVTNEVCGLQTQVRNVPWFQDWEPEYFTATLRMERALALHDRETRRGLEEYMDASIGSLADAKRMLAQLTERYVKRGAVGIKLAHAYERTLASDNVPEATAARCFDRMLSGGRIGPADIRCLQDHLIYYLADLAGQMGLVFQIHTGVQRNWRNLPDSNPLHLIPLLAAFPDVRFDLFHAGYPWSREMGMLAKHYPNVWLNMAWMYCVSVAASRQLLSEWIDLVPGYRLLGFGSDVGFPEFIYGHLVMARSCVADVLAAKVERDFLSEEEAVSLARRMFRDNAIELYGLDV